MMSSHETTEVLWKPSTMTANHDDSPIVSTFHVPGLLECMLSYVDKQDLLLTALVSCRWKAASRYDALWLDISKREASTFLTKYHRPSMDDEIPLFWRSLFTKSALLRMTKKQLLSILGHPLVASANRTVQLDSADLTEVQRLLQLHMLDVVSSNTGRSLFFSDIFFGSYACMIRDSKRENMLPAELCTSLGFDVCFKASETDMEQSNVEGLVPYEEHPGILLYYHTVCRFRDDHGFEMEKPTYHTGELSWRWLQGGRHVQVGHYPPLAISRQKDWGWKLENLYVVLLHRSG